MHNVVPETLAHIRLMPKSCKDLLGHVAEYVEMAGWWDTCSITYTTLATLPVPVPVGPSPVPRVSFFSAWASPGSTSTEATAVEGLFEALEKLLHPLLAIFELELIAHAGCLRDKGGVALGYFVEGKLGLGLGNCVGVWAQKCSPSTMLLVRVRRKVRTEEGHTMNLRSFVSMNQSTASILLKGCGESLILPHKKSLNEHTHI